MENGGPEVSDTLCGRREYQGGTARLDPEPFVSYPRNAKPDPPNKGAEQRI